MDIELARTFLEVISSGSFVETANRLHLTQTAVTARINNLERKLDCRLFTRNRAGARLTPDGERFAKYATSLVQTWDEARVQMQLPGTTNRQLRIGSEISLWNPVLVKWSGWLQENIDHLALHLDVADRDSLVEKLGTQTLDIILVHRPNYYSGFIVEQLLEEKLIHVRSTKKPGPAIFVDWGEEFRAQYEAILPGPTQAMHRINHGPLALRLILQSGGNGYFRTRVAKPYIEQGLLEKIPDTPEFSYPVYAVYRKNSDTALIHLALRGVVTDGEQNNAWLL